MDSGVIPGIMKAANIIPVHRGGSRWLAKNYMPITLTSHLIKVFEKVLSKSSVAFMEMNNRESLSMPTGHSTWKCLVTEIRPAEEVALTALPGHSDAQIYYNVTM